MKKHFDFKKYWRVWRQMVNNNFGVQTASRIDSFCYLIGKILRFAFFLILIFAFFNHTNNLAGYSVNEVLLFFMTFNLVDVVSQAFFRGIYHTQNLVRLGQFDYYLSTPINPLFRIASYAVDLLDFIFLIPIIFILIWAILNLGIPLTFIQIFLYFLLCFVGFLIAFSIHTIIAGIAVWTLESENLIWVYRDVLTFGRFPPEIFSKTVQIIFTFGLPIIVMIAFPTKVLLGILSWQWIGFSFFICFIFIFSSIKFWRFALKHYSSASS
jgi:ABC-2 type transport system permease protein